MRGRRGRLRIHVRDFEDGGSGLFCVHNLTRGDAFPAARCSRVHLERARRGSGHQLLCVNGEFLHGQGVVVGFCAERVAENALSGVGVPLDLECKLVRCVFLQLGRRDSPAHSRWPRGGARAVAEAGRVVRFKHVHVVHHDADVACAASSRAVSPERVVVLDSEHGLVALDLVRDFALGYGGPRGPLCQDALHLALDGHVCGLDLLENQRVVLLVAGPACVQVCMRTRQTRTYGAFISIALRPISARCFPPGIPTQPAEWSRTAPLGASQAGSSNTKCKP